MPLSARALTACLAVFIVWTMVRGFREGVVYDEGQAIEEDQSPMMFAVSMAVRGGFVVFFLWLAAGYDSASFARVFGLSWLTALTTH